MAITRVKDKSEELQFDDLQAGTYPCTLTVSDCMVPKLQRINGELKRSGDERPGVKFSFKVDSKMAWIAKKVANTTSSRGALYKMIQLLCDEWRKIKFDDKGFAVDEEFFYGLIENLDKKRFSVTCSKKGEYTNFETAEPFSSSDEIPFGNQNGGPAPRAPLAETVSFEDDDLPF